MEAVFLAGGFGTRISGVLANTPKCLAPIRGGGVFMDLMIHRLLTAGVTQFTFLTHYLHDQIQGYLSDRYKNMSIRYIREKTPLGTGGCLLQAIEVIRGDCFLVLNADTYLECKIEDFIRTRPPTLGIKLAAVKVPDCRRYGRVEIRPDGLVGSFLEKDENAATSGFINAGVYLVDRGFSPEALKGSACSLEKDIFPKLLIERKLAAWPTEAKFLDIGTPEDLALAQSSMTFSDKT